MDKKSSTGFEGLPEEWRILLKNSGISKEETLDNPQLVLDVLEFRSGDRHRPPPPMVKDAKMAAKMACSFIMKDPSQTYVDLVQVVDPLAGLVNCIMRCARLRFATKVCSRTDNSSDSPDVPGSANAIPTFFLYHRVHPRLASPPLGRSVERLCRLSNHRVDGLLAVTGVLRCGN